MSQAENQKGVIEALWEKYRDNHIRFDTPPDDIKALAKVFYAGAMLSIQELINIHKEVYEVIFQEFREFDKEMSNENNNRNDSSQRPKV